MRKTVAFSLIIILFIGIRVVGLGPDITNTDAPRWHYRSQNFLQALKTGNFDDTYQHYQPGVTLMWLNAITKQVTHTYPYLENSEMYPTIHFYSKLAIVLTLATLLVAQIKLVEQLFSTKTAVIFGILIATEPYLIGIDRWFHLTSLETYFAFTSFLALLVWQKSNSQKMLYASAVLFGLSVLSKITTLLIFPVFLYILLSKKSAKSAGQFILITAITGFILFPALVTDFWNVVTKIITAGGNAVSANYRHDLLTPFNQVFFYFGVLGFKLGFVTLFVFLLSLVNVKNKYLWLLLVNYLIILTIAQQKIDRYTIALFPPILLACALYLSNIRQKYLYLFSVCFLFQIIYSVGTFAPVYSAYYSPLFGGTKAALKNNLYDNSGEYFAQAAQYLNTLGRDNTVSVVNGLASFQLYYAGKVQTEVTEDTDYVISSFDLTRTEIENYNCPNLLKTFGNDQMQVVYVFKCK